MSPKNLLLDADETAWRRWKESPRRVLAVDYDGTLAPFRAERMQAIPIPGTTKSLHQLDRSGLSVVVVSGRPIDELTGLIGDLDVPMIGAHGWEYRRRDGQIDLRRPPRPTRELLRRAEEAAAAFVSRTALERKVSGVVLHTRSMESRDAAEAGNAVGSAWSAIIQNSADLAEIRAFNGGIELRLHGTNKGVALRLWIEESAPGAAPMFIGDDDTDEDAFREILDLNKTGVAGMGVRVGATLRGSAARARLPDCEAVARFLDALVEETRPTPGSLK